VKIYGKMITLRPSSELEKYLAEIGSPYIHFEGVDQLLLFPTVITSRGKANSFKIWKRSGQEIGKIECFFVNNSLMDAFAIRPNLYAVCVHDSLAYAMVDIFSMCFSLEGFFTEIGNPNLEDTTRVKERSKPTGYGYFRKDKNIKLNLDKDLTDPKCKVRSQASLYFCSIALDIIWSHEISHIFYGHLDFSTKSLGIKTLNETPSELGDLRLMPLEFEADRFGLISAIQTNHQNSFPYLPLSLKALSIKTKIKAVIIAHSLLTWFWAFQQKIDRTYDKIDPYLKGSHPPPLFRLHSGFEVSSEYLLKLRWSKKEIEILHKDCLKELEILAENKDWFSILHPNKLFNTDSTKFISNIKEILKDTFSKINPELSNYRFIA